MEWYEGLGIIGGLALLGGAGYYAYKTYVEVPPPPPDDGGGEDGGFDTEELKTRLQAIMPGTAAVKIQLIRPATSAPEEIQPAYMEVLAVNVLGDPLANQLLYFKQVGHVVGIAGTLGKVETRETAEYPFRTGEDGRFRIRLYPIYNPGLTKSASGIIKVYSKGEVVRSLDIPIEIIGCIKWGTSDETKWGFISN